MMVMGIELSERIFISEEAYEKITRGVGRQSKLWKKYYF